MFLVQSPIVCVLKGKRVVLWKAKKVTTLIILALAAEYMSVLAVTGRGSAYAKQGFGKTLNLNLFVETIRVNFSLLVFNHIRKSRTTKLSFCTLQKTQQHHFSRGHQPQFQSFIPEKAENQNHLYTADLSCVTSCIVFRFQRTIVYIQVHYAYTTSFHSERDLNKFLITRLNHVKRVGSVKHNTLT